MKFLLKFYGIYGLIVKVQGWWVLPYPPFNSPVWPVQKTAVSWRMTVATAAPDVVLFDGANQLTLSTWHGSFWSDRWLFPAISVGGDHQKHLQFTFTVLPKVYSNSPALHRITTGTLVTFSIPQDIILVHYINGITLIRPVKQKVATLDTLVEHMHARGW